MSTLRVNRIQAIDESVLNFDTGNINSSGIVTATAFVGVGSDITGLTGSNIEYGTISDARLPDLITSNINISSGISTFNDIKVGSAVTIGSSGIITATSFYGTGSNLTGLTLSSKSSSYTLVATDVGSLISITTGGVTVPSGVFSAGQSIVVYNNSGSSQTIIQGASATLRLAGTADTGNRTLEQRGLSTILCVASNEFIITGSGLL